jgi:hypothetical protein
VATETRDGFTLGPFYVNTPFYVRSPQNDHLSTGCLEDARVCCLAFWGTSPGSLLMSPFPPSGNSSKKPTREWEPLSEPKVNACLPACAIASPPLGPGGGQLQSKHVGISSRQDVPSAGAAVPGSLRASGFPARGIQGLGSHGVSCMRAGLRCMALHPECLRTYPGSSGPLDG